MSSESKTPRILGREAIQSTLPADLWAQNDRFTQSLRAKILRHPISSHPLREFFDTETLNKEKTLTLHLEFGYGFAQIFTDAVLHAMAIAQQLEGRLGPKAKSTARFLWALNLMDELGYVPSGNTENFAGNPMGAHYLQFVDMFRQLGAPVQSLNTYVASDAAKEARRSFERHYDDYVLLTTVLALSESIFDKFAGSWANNVGRSADLDVSQGYHTIHVQHEDGHSVDDDHSEDSWTLVKQALVTERYAEVDARVDECLDIWARFADAVMHMAAS